MVSEIEIRGNCGGGYNYIWFKCEGILFLQKWIASDIPFSIIYHVLSYN